MEMINILGICGCVPAILAIFLLVRNDNVYMFRVYMLEERQKRLLERLYSYKDDTEFHNDKDNYDRLNEYLMALCEKYSYDEMLLSIRPLRLEFWYSEDEISLLLGE